MAKLYANENMALEVIERLRELGHDVLLTIEAGKANQGIPDDQVLSFAHPAHSGVIICKMDINFVGLANRINEALNNSGEKLDGQLIRIVRPNP